MHVRLFHDMAHSDFQIEALAHHSVFGLEAVMTGVFAPCPVFCSSPRHGRAIRSLRRTPRQAPWRDFLFYRW